ncbi:MAG: STAS domain-containing protein [Firmicutes bacterium]|nr:STAS domain-containing protein [Bacillota bacterium]MBQ1630446.1 STAS domain-containing protein [Bacillota bacterium]MBQ2304575.1 STAS domain-containing protein [Bacillota bacterium]
MTITQSVNEGIWNIALEGRLDINTSPDLEDLIKDEPDEIRGIVLDMGEMNYISSAGLRVVLLMLKKMNKAGKIMKLINVTDPVYEVFELTGFTDILNIERA